MAAYVIATHHISISRACKVICLPKSMYYYKKTKDDTQTIKKLQELAEKHPTERLDGKTAVACILLGDFVEFIKPLTDNFFELKIF